MGTARSARYIFRRTLHASHRHTSAHARLTLTLTRTSPPPTRRQVAHTIDPRTGDCVCKLCEQLTPHSWACSTTGQRNCFQKVTKELMKKKSKDEEPGAGGGVGDGLSSLASFMGVQLNAGAVSEMMQNGAEGVSQKRPRGGFKPDPSYLQPTPQVGGWANANPMHGQHRPVMHGGQSTDDALDLSADEAFASSLLNFGEEDDFGYGYGNGNDNGIGNGNGHRFPPGYGSYPEFHHDNMHVGHGDENRGRRKMARTSHLRQPQPGYGGGRQGGGRARSDGGDACPLCACSFLGMSHEQMHEHIDHAHPEVTGSRSAANVRTPAGQRCTPYPPAPVTVDGTNGSTSDNMAACLGNLESLKLDARDYLKGKTEMLKADKIETMQW